MRELNIIVTTAGAPVKIASRALNRNKANSIILITNVKNSINNLSVNALTQELA